MKTQALYNTVLINYSVLNTVKVGKFYTTLELDNKCFLFDEDGKKILIKEPELKWKSVDKVVMLVKIKSSLLDTISPDKIYRVFNDEENDERYVFDENSEKVLFDKMLFNYELV